MVSWDGWPFERIALIFTGLAFGMITIQVFLMHLGGAFHKWQMWIPVLYGPVLMILGLGLGVKMSAEAATAGLVFFGIGLLGGIGGTFYHLRAIGQYVMGYTLRNYVAGPPPVLPATFAAMSAFGMLAVYWGAYVR
jgi:hypothetical protein